MPRELEDARDGERALGADVHEGPVELEIPRVVAVPGDAALVIVGPANLSAAHRFLQCQATTTGLTHHSFRSSFSAVSTPILATKQSFFSIFEDLQDFHNAAPSEFQNVENFVKNFVILKVV